MGKFVVSGVIVEEPRKSKSASGVDYVSVVLEEKYRTPYSKEIVNLYDVCFMGKSTNCVPRDYSVVGMPAIVTGSLRGRTFKDHCYVDLIGDGLTIINTHTFSSVQEKKVNDNGQPPVETKPKNHDGTFEPIEVSDDDLPF